MTKPDIGFIGLGVMGDPMAGHIANAGYKVSAYDINKDCCDRVAGKYPGVQILESPSAIAEVSEIVVTMLPSGEYVREAALGENGLVHGFREGAILLDTSSCEPWITVETAVALSEKGIGMVDAPVSGAQIGAINAELVFMLGGEKEAIDQVSPLLDIMGKQRFHLGPTGAGHAMKCINNMITSVNLLALSEGLAIGKKFNLDPEIMTDVLNVSTGGSWVSQTHIKQRIISRKFDDPFKLGLMLKDVEIAMQLAENLELPLQLSGLNRELWRQASEQEGADTSVSNLVRWVEHTTGVEISAGNNN